MISSQIKRLLDITESYKVPIYLSASAEDSAIEVDNITSQAAHYYERIRYAIDYKDEDILQRSAIERIIKRKITFSSDTNDISKELISELIQAGYLPNGKIAQSSINIVQIVIDKTVIFMDLIRDMESGIKNTLFDSMIIGLCACEIEDILFPSVMKEAAADALYSYMRGNVTVVGSELSTYELEMQIYIASHKSLLKSDDTRLFYNMWIISYPEWINIDISDSENRKRLGEMSEQYLSIRENLKNQLKHPVQSKLIPKLRNHVIYFSAILGVLGKFGKEASGIFSNYDRLSDEVGGLISQKYIDEKKRVNKMAWRAVFYILITKIILALLIELPYDLFVANAINYLALGINIIFHPLLLIAITRSVVTMGEENTNRIISGVNDIVYGAEKKKIFLDVTDKKNILLYIVFILYSLLFVLSFGFIILMLNKLGFNWVGMVFFIFFLALVSFFGLRIRYIAKIWTVHVKNSGFIAFIWDVFTLPIIFLGRWLTEKFASINIFVFIMDFIIETPFKIFLKISDSFISLIKEKKEEIY